MFRAIRFSPWTLRFCSSSLCAAPKPGKKDIWDGHFEGDGLTDLCLFSASCILLTRIASLSQSCCLWIPRLACYLWNSFSGHQLLKNELLNFPLQHTKYDKPSSATDALVNLSKIWRVLLNFFLSLSRLLLSICWGVPVVLTSYFPFDPLFLSK